METPEVQNRMRKAGAGAGHERSEDGFGERRPGTKGKPGGKPGTKEKSVGKPGVKQRGNGRGAVRR